MITRSSIMVVVLTTIFPIASAAGELSKLFKQVSDSVVILRVFERAPMPKNMKSDEKLTSVEGLGSGVVISADGKILTAAHVVHLADSIHVDFANGKKAMAKVIASEPIADVALLKLETVPKDMVHVPLGNSDGINVGDDVFVIGAPYGISHSLTAGFISGRRKSDSQEAFGGTEFFQTDASINQGNSGGPMFNLNGEVIGIVSHILSRSGGFEGMGFAVTINTAKHLLLEKRGFWSGLQGRVIKGNLAEIFHIPQDSALLVERVAENSMSQKAGIRAGDVLATIDGVDMILGGDVILSLEGIQVGTAKAYSQIREKMRSRRPGDKIKLRLLRGHQIKVVHVIVPNDY